MDEDVADLHIADVAEGIGDREEHRMDALGEGARREAQRLAAARQGQGDGGRYGGGTGCERPRYEEIRPFDVQEQRPLVGNAGGVPEPGEHIKLAGGRELMLAGR